MVTGKAVRGFTLMFLQLWDVAAGGRSDYLKYLNASAPVPARGWVMPYGGHPRGPGARGADGVYGTSSTGPSGTSTSPPPT